MLARAHPSRRGRRSDFGGRGVARRRANCLVVPRAGPGQGLLRPAWMLILASREDSFQNSDLGADRRFAEAVRGRARPIRREGTAMNKEDMILISVDDHTVE